MYKVAYLDNGKLVETPNLTLSKAIFLAESYSEKYGYSVMYEVNKNFNFWFKEGRAIDETH